MKWYDNRAHWICNPELSIQESRRAQVLGPRSSPSTFSNIFLNALSIFTDTGISRSSTSPLNRLLIYYLPNLPAASLKILIFTNLSQTKQWQIQSPSDEYHPHPQYHCHPWSQPSHFLSDYCNFLHNLQLFESSAAHIITRTPSTHHFTTIVQDLGWLPLNLCVIFKILLLTFEAFSNPSPPLHTYLPSSILPLPPTPSGSVPTYTCLFPPSDHHREKSNQLLWNSLPPQIRNMDLGPLSKSTTTDRSVQNVFPSLISSFLQIFKNFFNSMRF